MINKCVNESGDMKLIRDEQKGMEESTERTQCRCLSDAWRRGDGQRIHSQGTVFLEDLCLVDLLLSLLLPTPVCVDDFFIL